MAKLFSWFKRKKSDETAAALPPTEPAEPVDPTDSPTDAGAATQAPSMSSDAVVRKSTAPKKSAAKPSASKSGAKTSTKAKKPK